MLVSGEEILGDFSISLSLVQPGVTRERPLAVARCVGDFHFVQQPARTQTRVVVLHPDLSDLT